MNDEGEIKELKINNDVYAKYMIEGPLIYIKRLKNIVRNEPSSSEDVLVKIISLLENKEFTAVAYLNVK